MRLFHVINKLSGLLRRFKADDRGTISVNIVIMLMPMLASFGGAVDIGLVYSARNQLQIAADATAVAMAKEAVADSASVLQTNGERYFKAVCDPRIGTPITVTVTYSKPVGGASTVTVTAATTVQMSFLQLVGQTTMDVAASSQTTWGSTRVRVAMVLDNTGSMAQSGKMDALKTASHNLLGQLKSAVQTDGDAYISIVPFTKDVNVGASNVSADWVRWDLWDAANQTYNRTTRTYTTNSHSTWNGCVTDRDQNYDTTNAVPTTSNSATLFPAEQYSVCPVALLPLTYDWTALNNKIDEMVPNGNTNQSIGLQWGLQSLTAAPFTIPAYDPNFSYQKVIILLTDGLNTQDRWYTNQSSIDARQRILCDNIKQAGVTIYAIQVNTGGDPTSSLLQYCASDSSKFFLLTNSSQIISVFNSIGTALSNLRISQ